ncbi:MAG TPA: AAA family ATPase [Bacillota bacterium]
MRIKNLHILDFGILRNQTLSQLKPGMVVIGGFNRAGKTTFLQVLRYLFYGIKRSAKLPPPAQEYRIEAELVLADGREASVRLRGYAQPEVYLNGGEKVTAEVIHGRIDEFTYERLFTISLNELCNLPEGAGREVTKLQSVLLGAGLTDAVVIPQLCAELKKVAEGIGGKHGSPGVRMFKESYHAILKGLKMRDEALAQVTAYEETRRRLGEVRREIATAKAELSRAEAELLILEFVNQYYDDYQQIQKINQLLAADEGRRLLDGFPLHRLEKARHLKELNSTLLAEYKQTLLRVEGVLGSHLAHYQQILNCRAEIREAARQSAGIRQQLEHLRTGLERLRRDEIDIKLEMDEVNREWQGDFQKVLALNCDHLRMNELSRKLAELHSCKDRVEEGERQVEENHSEQAIIRELLLTLPSLDPGKYFRRFCTLSLLFLCGGYLLTRTQSGFGFYLGVGGVLISGFYLLFSFLQGREVRDKRRQLEEDFKRKEEMSVQRLAKLEEEKKALAKLSTEILEYQRVLELPTKEILPDLLPDYLKRVQDLKRRISLYQEEEERLSGLRRNLLEEINSLSALAAMLGYLSDQQQDLLEAGAAVLECIQEMAAHLELLGQLEDYEKRLLNVGQDGLRILQEYKEGWLELASKQVPVLSGSGQGQVDVEGHSLTEIRHSFEIMDEWLSVLIREGEKALDLKEEKERAEHLKRGINQAFNFRVKEAWQKTKGGQGGEAEAVEILATVCREFISLDEVRRRHAELGKTISGLQNHLTQLEKEQTTMENRLEVLATSDKLAEAQKMIDEARGRLEPLARKYAVYNIAALILQRLHEGFLEKTKGELLKPAGEIFAKLTGEAYLGIAPADDLLTPDFKAVTVGGRELEGTALLSRGTREQLFLSVRLSRIREIRPALPVILDDSLVNFDVKHTRQAIEILADLAFTHQVFILTCHPEMIEHIKEVNRACGRTAQYWRIAGGRIEPVEAGELGSYLRGETLDL